MAAQAIENWQHSQQKLGSTGDSNLVTTTIADAFFHKMMSTEVQYKITILVIQSTENTNIYLLICDPICKNLNFQKLRILDLCILGA